MGGQRLGVPLVDIAVVVRVTRNDRKPWRGEYVGLAAGAVAGGARDDGTATDGYAGAEGIRIGAGVIPFFFVLLGILPMLFSPINQA